MAIYNIITTVDIEQITPEGIIIIPANSVINTILWDGVSEYNPPENTIIQFVSDS